MVTGNSFQSISAVEVKSNTRPCPAVPSSSSGRPSGRANKTFLFGRCMVKARGKDPRIKEAVPIDGCPPTYETLLKAFTDNGVEAKPEMLFGLRESIMKRYLSDPAFDLQDYYLQGAPV